MLSKILILLLVSSKRVIEAVIAAVIVILIFSDLGPSQYAVMKNDVSSGAEAEYVLPLDHA